MGAFLSRGGPHPAAEGQGSHEQTPASVFPFYRSRLSPGEGPENIQLSCGHRQGSPPSSAPAPSPAPGPGCPLGGACRELSPSKAQRSALSIPPSWRRPLREQSTGQCLAQSKSETERHCHSYQPRASSPVTPTGQVWDVAGCDRPQTPRPGAALPLMTQSPVSCRLSLPRASLAQRPQHRAGSESHLPWPLGGKVSLPGGEGQDRGGCNSTREGCSEASLLMRQR